MQRLGDTSTEIGLPGIFRKIHKSLPYDQNRPTNIEAEIQNLTQVKRQHEVVIDPRIT